ncbi:hypothetical protein IWX75_003543 [Arthrobacter sp. CAN_A6]
MQLPELFPLVAKVAKVRMPVFVWVLQFVGLQRARWRQRYRLPKNQGLWRAYWR